MCGEWFIVAPGPSLTRELTESLRGRQVAAVCNAYELAPWAAILVANDRGWWTKHPAAYQFAGRKFSANRIPDVEQVKSTFGTASNSGALALDVVRDLGATRVLLVGFDFHGTHFFGPYTNGLRNTPDRQRQVHQSQFQQWAAKNRKVEVINCTPGSMLEAFPRGRLEDYLG